MKRTLPVVLRVTQIPEDSAIVPGTVFPVRSARAVLGRAPDADVVLPDRTVSRHHALIDVGERVTVTALTESNGTFLDQVPLTPGRPVPVPPQGAPLQLGGLLLDVVVLADETAPVLEPLAGEGAPPTERWLTAVWDGGQCALRCGRRDLGLTGVPARFLGSLAERVGEVVHYWDLQQELQTRHLAPLATLVRQALLGALEAGALDDAALRERIADLTGHETERMSGTDLMRSLVQARRGHGYVLNLVESDVLIIRV